MNRIAKIKSLINENFPTDWIEIKQLNAVISDSPSILETFEGFKTNLNSLKEDIFDNFNLAILEGEFAENSNYLEDIIQLKEIFKGVNPQNDSYGEDSIQSYFLSTSDLGNQLNFKSQFYGPISFAINHYYEFVLFFKRKLDVFSQKEYVEGSYNEEIEEVVEKKIFDENSIKNIQLLAINIRVARIDLSLSIESQQINELTKYSSQLRHKGFIKSYIPIIIKKINHLKYKLIFRNKHEKLTNKVYIIINGDEIKIQPEKLNLDPLSKEWLYYSYFYSLEIEDNEELIREKFGLLRNKEFKDLTIEEIHIVTKYYKDVELNFEGSVSKIDELKEVLVDRLNHAKKENNSFNIYSNSICLNYVSNNIFSIYCEFEESLDVIKIEYSKILNFQAETGIKNFFPQVKYSNYLLKKLETIFKEEKVFEKTTECNEIISLCKKLDNEYKINVEWTKSNYNYVYQLPFNECCLNVSSGEIKLFIFSSFLLPLPKIRFTEEYNIIAKSIANYESALNISKSVNNEFKKLNTLKGELKEIKDKDSRMLEILGIFTAIISFVAASLPTFSLIKTPLEAALFMLALSTSLASFVFLILVTFRGIDKLKERKNYIISSVIIAIVLWSILIYISGVNNLNTTKKHSISKAITTLNKNMNFLKIDQIKNQKVDN